MFLVFFFLFVVLNGKLTLEIALFGAAFAALFYSFCCKFMGYSIEMDKRLVKGAVAGVRYLAMLLGEIVKANVTMIRLILTPGFEPEPQLVSFDADLQDMRHRVALADSITLTPGTITCDLKEDRLVVHCLDRSLMKDLDRSVFVQALKEMEAESAEEENKLPEEETAGQEIADADTEENEIPAQETE
ncbi:MAG: Na+/H+ antiporter subunit E, partial [Eubacterium sp.]|nr:Na+/H+ antiporter subunit E [Eubacterium sp.]